MMKVLITGASGMVGTALSAELKASGHEVVGLTRNRASENAVYWNPEAGELDVTQLNGIEAVVHLAGENIAAGRWSDKQKSKIRESRVGGTKLLCETLASMEQKPQVLVSASAIGFYGDRGDEELTEDSSVGTGFLPEVCQEWEAATEPAKAAGIRVVNLRIGVVLSKDGGALKAMMFPFMSCLGGIVGNGKQYWSWIALADLVGVIAHALQTDTVSGPVNAVSPNTVTNHEFTKTLGAVIGRPTIFPLPGFVAKIMLGEMADGLLLASARVLPNQLQASGYEFRYPELKVALAYELGK